LSLLGLKGLVLNPFNQGFLEYFELRFPEYVTLKFPPLDKKSVNKEAIFRSKRFLSMYQNSAPKARKRNKMNKPAEQTLSSNP